MRMISLRPAVLYWNACLSCSDAQKIRIWGTVLWIDVGSDVGWVGIMPVSSMTPRRHCSLLSKRSRRVHPECWLSRLPPQVSPRRIVDYAWSPRMTSSLCCCSRAIMNRQQSC
ncbi:hypothetical protein L210DRAFT_3539951 [Boletus edulis BED1]|uniref:Uncharacterized protein n=1 Tax=Boletus edulis BED1 TaxID=1328754 RepID=A0AAD4GFC2_BOLED|nr:hypothetical protein L210DRAFT_3565960 [Boletus edulis BED1]KAF8440552.1 hypothetical protein L210DRAFT_3539951 [Boletus edulis BED1]